MSIISLILETIENVTYLYFSDNVVYLCLVLFSISVIIIKKRRNSSIHTHFVYYSIIIGVLFLYNPLFLHLIELLPGSTGSSVYARLWIVVPVWFIVAYALVIIIIDLNKTIIKYSFVIGASLLIVLYGNSIVNLNMINTPTNIYKVRCESIEIIDEVMELSNQRPVSVFIMVPVSSEGENYENGGTIVSGMKQYSGEIAVYSHSYSNEYWDNYIVSDTTPDNISSDAYWMSFLHYWNSSFDCEYAILPDDLAINTRIERLGYERLSSVSGYNIYYIA